MGSVLPGGAQVMHHGNHRPPRFPDPAANQLQQLLLILQNQKACQLIEHQQTRPLGKHLGEKSALQFPAGQGEHAGMAQVF